ncbi:MAG TPA: hypothetical protein VGK24_09540 [Candidatus Angelobacter sp.]|jgi:hypothetical protein
MSKASERLQAAMDRHSLNAANCQAANQAKANADASFVASAVEVAASLTDVNDEMNNLAAISSAPQQPQPPQAAN